MLSIGCHYSTIQDFGLIWSAALVTWSKAAWYEELVRFSYGEQWVSGVNMDCYFIEETIILLLKVRSVTWCYLTTLSLELFFITLIFNIQSYLTLHRTLQNNIHDIWYTIVFLLSLQEKNITLEEHISSNQLMPKTRWLLIKWNGLSSKRLSSPIKTQPWNTAWRLNYVGYIPL